MMVGPQDGGFGFDQSKKYIKKVPAEPNEHCRTPEGWPASQDVGGPTELESADDL